MNTPLEPTNIKRPKNVIRASILGLAILCLSLTQTGCASRTAMIAGGMLAGAAVGAGTGYEFVHHGDHKQYETRNTIITSAVFALIFGGVLAWHYREIEQTKVEVSGRYSRYRLCDPDEMQAELSRQLQMKSEEDAGNIYKIDGAQVGKLAISLDDSTKWVYPTFRKRFLQPERGETQVISTRYIWEIVKPGFFVTRSQDPQYFLEINDKPVENQGEQNEKENTGE